MPALVQARGPGRALRVDGKLDSVGAALGERLEGVMQQRLTDAPATPGLAHGKDGDPPQLHAVAAQGDPDHLLTLRRHEPQAGVEPIALDCPSHVAKGTGT